MTIAGLWTNGDWRHVVTGCTVLVNITDDHDVDDHGICHNAGRVTRSWKRVFSASLTTARSQTTASRWETPFTPAGMCRKSSLPTAFCAMLNAQWSDATHSISPLHTHTHASTLVHCPLQSNPIHTVQRLWQRHTLQKPAPENWRRFLARLSYNLVPNFSGTRFWSWIEHVLFCDRIWRPRDQILICDWSVFNVVVVFVRWSCQFCLYVWLLKLFNFSLFNMSWTDSQIESLITFYSSVLVSGARNFATGVKNRRQKPTPVFWRRFLEHVSWALLEW